MSVHVKICGTTNYEDASLALDLGADAIGFIFYDKSPRYVAPSTAQEIIRRLPPFAVKVGVFVNEFNVSVVRNVAMMCGLNVIQLHGSEAPEYCSQLRDWPVVKALRVSDAFDATHCRDFPVSAVLLDAYDPDTYGGTGRLFDWGKALEAKQYARIILAGGLRPDNVGSAIRSVKPYAVDVSSGVESKPGQKDKALMRMFFEAVEKARAETANTSGSLSHQIGEWFQA
jgi:phosphoribosylanthranilate isomerase